MDRLVLDTSVFARSESRVRYYCRRFPAVFSRAVNETIWDEAGREYIDFFSAAGSLNYGHNHPKLKEALLSYIATDGLAISLDMYSSAKARFLERFEALLRVRLGGGFRVMFPGPTGTNAVEAALKLARKVTGRSRVAAFTNAFHGMTLGALAATASRSKRQGAGVPLGDVDRYPYEGYHGAEVDTLAIIDRMLCDPGSGHEPPAAFLLETVQGEGGLNAASATWLRGLAALCERHGSLLIVDDIQAGCGRADQFFSFEFAGVRPDIVCLSKSLSGLGLPLSVLLLRETLDVWDPGEHNGTFRGNNHAFVTAAAALDFWEDAAFEAQRQKLTATTEAWLEAQAARHGRERALPKGRGMMRGLRLPSGEFADQVCAGAFQQGLIMETSGSRGEVIKLMPPLTADPGRIEQGLDIIARELARVLDGGEAATPDGDAAYARA
ncbi:MAG TPA: diaminobutyrate--2-oxoglutarate transaminase [Allosphingosinicella sp.]